MRRFFVDSPVSDTAELTGDEFNHLKNVLRIGQGEKAELCDRSGKVFVCTVESVGKNSARLKAESFFYPDTEEEYKVVLYQSIPKSDKLELICKSFTELGGAEVVPFVSKFSQVKPDNVRCDRLEKISVEAAKQCGRAVPLKICGPVSFSAMTDSLSGNDINIFAYEKEKNATLKSVFEREKNRLAAAGAALRIGVIVGAEGGFTDEEAGVVQSAGAYAITLGRRILRLETASLCLMSKIHAYFEGFFE